MKAFNTLGENGKAILEYIPESDADVEEIFAMKVDGKLPDVIEPVQPERTTLVLTD